MSKVVNNGKLIFSFNVPNGTLDYDTDTQMFNNDITPLEVLRFFKGLWKNYDRFHSRFWYKVEKVCDGNQPFLDYFSQQEFDLYKFVVENFDTVKPFSYAEAFQLKNDAFRALVFSSIDITEMINELGNRRIKTDGINVKHQRWNSLGEEIGYEEFYNIYETYEVFGEKLGLTENVYAVKCWCTSTNKEHWIWIDEQFKDDPLQAIASTFVVHENLIPHIKRLKRQGDVLLVETDDADIELTGPKRSLTKEEYFSLLVAQS
jgi:hypothetical protein